MAYTVGELAKKLSLMQPPLAFGNQMQVTILLPCFHLAYDKNQSIDHNWIHFGQPVSVFYRRGTHTYGS